ncbi:tyrosine-type recombinase/integrase [Amycolatopsis pigmentata]|uniref:Tyrosine-type recombinase/integrase n=1 Tax=Amycolatopsis pigmentata TaxID=450801 RepID=A0ABW5FNX8_9PSEU
MSVSVPEAVSRVAATALSASSGARRIFAACRTRTCARRRPAPHRHRFTDPRLAQTTIDEWIRSWSDAHHVADLTWSTYDSHIRYHILPRWSGTALGDIQRIAVKGWVNKTLRTKLADKSVQDILVLLSMILGEAVDEGLIGANPCRKLRISFAERPERPHATTDEVDALAGRMAPDAGLLTVTAAYTGLRWGELAGLQWHRTYLGTNPRIEVDPEFGALHEINGRLELGPPKTPASVRTVQRRSNFRRRVWLPALAGDEKRGWAPLNQEMHFHDLRHTHETWLVEDGVPRILRLVRLGHKRKDIDDHYSHVTDTMVANMLAALQRRWEQDGGWTWEQGGGWTGDETHAIAPKVA